MSTFFPRLNREESIFALAVLPAAYAWIILELGSLFSIAIGAALYLALSLAYEYVASRANWQHLKIASLFRRIKLEILPSERILLQQKFKRLNSLRG